MIDQEPVFCTGCHFRCELQRFQCGRGEVFWGIWNEAGEVPRRPSRLVDGNVSNPAERRQPPTPDMVAARLLQMAADQLRDRSDLSAAEGLAHALALHEGKATVSIAAQRARISEDRRDAAVDELVARGWVEQQPSPQGLFLSLTPEGKEAVKRSDQGRKASIHEFMEALSEDDVEELVRVLSQIARPPFGSPRQERRSREFEADSRSNPGNWMHTFVHSENNRERNRIMAEEKVIEPEAEAPVIEDRVEEKPEGYTGGDYGAKPEGYQPGPKPDGYQHGGYPGGPKPEGYQPGGYPGGPAPFMGMPPMPQMPMMMPVMMMVPVVPMMGMLPVGMPPMPGMPPFDMPPVFGPKPEGYQRGGYPGGPRPEGYQPGPRPDGYQRGGYPGGPKPEGYQPGPTPEGYQPGPKPEGYQPGPKPEGYQPGPKPEGYQPGPKPEGYSGGNYGA